MKNPLTDQLHRLYDEKIDRYSEFAGKWDRQECEYWELAEARSAMEIVAAILTRMEKRRSGR